MEEARQPSQKLWISVFIFIAGGLPAIVLRLSDAHIVPIFAALLYEPGSVAGAVLLSWAGAGARTVEPLGTW